MRASIKHALTSRRKRANRGFRKFDRPTKGK